MKTEEQIKMDLDNATKRSKAFFRECLMGIVDFNESYLQNEKKKTTYAIRTLLKRRKESGEKKLYKKELKRNRRFLKGLKYILK